MITAGFFSDALAVSSSGNRASKTIKTAITPTIPPVVPLTVELFENVAVEDLLYAGAYTRFGTINFAAAAAMIGEALPELASDWGGKKKFKEFLKGIRFTRLHLDLENSVLVIPAFKLDLPGWEEEDRLFLKDFVVDIVEAAKIPLLKPSEYTAVFEALVQAWNSNPQTFSDGINLATKICKDAAVKISAQQVRFIAQGISMQGVMLSGDMDPNALAGAFRENVFELSDSPDWLLEPEKVSHLAFWIKGANETVAEASQDFLRRVNNSASEKLEKTDENPSVF